MCLEIGRDRKDRELGSRRFLDFLKEILEEIRYNYEGKLFLI